MRIHAAIAVVDARAEAQRRAQKVLVARHPEDQAKRGVNRYARGRVEQAVNQGVRCARRVVRRHDVVERLTLCRRQLDGDVRDLRRHVPHDDARLRLTDAAVLVAHGERHDGHAVIEGGQRALELRCPGHVHPPVAIEVPLEGQHIVAGVEDIDGQARLASFVLR